MSEAQGAKKCPYCGAAITERQVMVVCAICRIPHHQECWDENRGCTTYGCPGTPVRRPGRRWGAILQGLLGVNLAVSLAGTMTVFIMLILYLAREGDPSMFGGLGSVPAYIYSMAAAVGLLAAVTGLTWKAADEGGGWPSLLAATVLSAVAAVALMSWLSFVPAVVFILSLIGTFVASKPQKLLMQTL